MILGRWKLTIQKITWSIAIFLFLSLVFVKGIDKGTATPISAPAIIGYSNSPSWWPWIIVDEQNLFEKKGINAKLEWYDSYSDSVRDLNAGLIDGNSQLLEDTKALDGKVGVLLNTFSDGEDKLIVKSGIDKIDDLKGKKIIAESATLSNHLLSLILSSEESSISVDDLEIQNLETGVASVAFASDRAIDGVISFPPYSTVALSREGSHELISSKAFPQQIARMLVVKQNMVENHPELVEKIIEVWFETLDFINSHPQIAHQIIARRTGIEIDLLPSFQKQVRSIDREEASKFKTLAQSVRDIH